MKNAALSTSQELGWSGRLRVFVASSSEQIATARAVADALESPRLDVHVWDRDIFEFSAAYIESLERELDRADFAVVIMTGHDAARVRGRAANLPRDNVIFELGLFLGRLGRKRTFFMVDKDSRTKIASDLSGVEPVVFESKERHKSYSRLSLRAQVAKLAQLMLPLGVRYKPSPDTRAKQAVLWQFSNSVAGHWWERVRGGDDKRSAVSFVLIEVDEMTNTAKLQAAAYDRKGEPLAEWETLTTSVLLGARPKLFYHWEGEHDAAHGQTYGGGGTILFESGNSGHGYFYDTNLAIIKQGARTRVKQFRIYRCSTPEIAIMSTPWTSKAQSLIKRKLRELKG